MKRFTPYRVYLSLIFLPKIVLNFNEYNAKVVVPIDQFQNMPKSHYVGTKLILPYNVQSYTSEFTKDCIGDIYICGFATYEQTERCSTVNLGEYPCKAKPLSDLMEIDWLLHRF